MSRPYNTGAPPPPPPPTAQWNELKIGAGGYLTGMDIANDGTMVCRTDTSGAYYWNPNLTNNGNGAGLPVGRWQQLLRNDTNADFIFAAKGGVYEIKVAAPPNTNIFYMLWSGHVYKTTNHGATWTRLTGFDTAIGAGFAAAWPSLGDNGGPPENDGARAIQGKIAIDPNDPNTVYVSTAGYDGMYVTHDGGTTWSRVPTVTNTRGNVINSIAIDGNSGIVSGQAYSKYIYCFSYDQKFFASFDGGTTWAALSGATVPGTNSNRSGRIKNGVYYACEGNSNGVYAFTPGAAPPGTGSWSQFAGATSQVASLQCHDIAFDPGSNKAWIVGIGGGGQVQYDPSRTNSFYGGNFSDIVSVTFVTITANDIPWLATTGGGSFGGNLSAGAFLFDPQVPNRLWQSMGTGVIYVDSPSATFNGNGGGSIPWQSQSSGIEQLVTQEVFAIPGSGGTIVTMNIDRSVLPSFDITKFPSFYMCAFNAGQGGWGGDYASDLSAICCVSEGAYEQTGFSLPPYTSWNVYPNGLPNGGSNTGFLGNCMAMSTKDNVIWVPPRGFGICFTLNGTSPSVSWTQITLPDGTTTFDTFGGFSSDRCVAADRVLANTFYYWGQNNFYKTINGGTTWTITGHTGNAGYPFKTLASTNSQGGPVLLKSVPANPGTNVAGHLFATRGFQAPDFWRSTDGGANWNTVPNVSAVSAFGFGKAAPGKTYPAVYIVGTVSGIGSVWRSDDNCVTWNNLGLPNTIDYIKCGNGDMDVYNRFYVGFNGSGYQYWG